MANNEIKQEISETNSFINSTSEIEKTTEYFEDIEPKNSVHEGFKNHKCETCGKAFTYPGHLKEHISSVHEGVKNHKCEKCGKAFSRADNLRSHIKSVHEGERNHKCDICGKAYSRAEKLRKHISSVHEGVSDLVEVQIRDGGDFQFEEYPNYGNQPEISNENSFIDSKIESTPYLIQEGTKKHKCETCGVSFGMAQTLQRHISSVHEGIKAYNCEICGKDFTRTSYLKKHIATVHDGERNHKCDTCGKCFTSGIYLLDAIVYNLNFLLKSILYGLGFS